jgi:hypothetical protein
MLSSSVFASHFRGGNASWFRTSGRTVQFTVITSWRSTFVDGFFWAYGDGGSFFSGNPPGTFLGQFVDSTNRAYRTYRRVFSHTYPADGPYNAYFDSCCRIFGLGNASSSSYRMQTVVYLGGGNNGSPVTSAPGILQIQDELVNTIVLPVGDPDGNYSSCRFATTAESGIPYHPSWMTASRVGNTCVMTMDTQGPAVVVGQLWAASVILLDSAGASSAADFIIEVIGQNDQPPTCAGGGSFTVSVGQSINIAFTGTDPEGSPITAQVLNPPPGASFGPSSGPSPLNSTLSWTAVPSDAGQSYAGTVIMSDASNLQALCGFTVNVPACVDTDGDTICDSQDNCVNTPNTSQSDSDNDGAGNACDVCPLDPRDILADTHDPIFIGPSLPADATVECDALPPPPSAPLAIDTCPSLPVTVTHSQSTVGDPSCGAYTILNTYTATDAAGNDTSYTQTVNVLDSTAPMLSCPGPFTVEQTSLAGTPVPFSCSASDNCSTVSLSDDALAVYPLGTTTVTVTATDCAGNSVSTSVDITVVDTTAPSVSVSGPSGYVCGDEGVVTADISDVCDTSPDVTVDPMADSSSQNGSSYSWTYSSEGVYDVLVTATDDSGNSGGGGAGPFAVDLTDPSEDFGALLDQGGVIPGDPSTYPLIYNTADLPVSLTASDPTPSGDDAASGLAVVDVVLDGVDMLSSNAYGASRGLGGAGGPLAANVQCDADPRCDGAGNLDLASLSTGPHSITVSVEDYACNLVETTYYFRVMPVPADFWCTPESMNVGDCGNWVNCWVELGTEPDDLGNLPPGNGSILAGSVVVRDDDPQIPPPKVASPEDTSWPGYPGSTNDSHGYHFRPSRSDPALGLAAQLRDALNLGPGDEADVILVVGGDLDGGGTFLSGPETHAGQPDSTLPTHVQNRCNR